MITSSSKSRRVIKRSDRQENLIIEQYELPREQAIARKASFPRYGKDGKRKEETGQPAREAALEEQRRQEASHFREEYLEEAQEEARALLEDAREQARVLLEDAREQAKEELEQARLLGYREGYENGSREGKIRAEAEVRQEFQENLAAFREDVEKALRSIDVAKEKCMRNYLDQLKDCAIAIGEKVVHISLRSSGEVIKQMIIAATEKLKKTAWVKIYMDKCDYDMMMEADAAILDELSHLSDNIKFIVMDKEDRGNCIIEMPEEIVDVSVNTQIENIKDILENVRV